MKKKKFGTRFKRLLIWLLAYLFFTPFISQDSYLTSLIVQGFLSVMLLYAALAVQKKQNQRSIALIIMGLALVVHWLGIFHIVPYSADAALVLFIGFYILLIYAFTKQLLRAQHVNSDVIIITLCLYLIIGLLWGSAYTLLQSIYGNAFSGALLENAGTSQVHIFNYFSIVTLTTLGYGDITPQIPEAASLCQIQAIIGQFYTAVLVAWLVGMYGKSVGKKDSLAD